MIARKYLYLIALARERHFGRAAAACHVSPSTLSSAISDLESELGVPVVERGKQFAGLTAEGRCVLEYAQRVAAMASGLRQELASLRDGLTGRLTLGVIPTGLTVVASLSAAMARRHPLVTIEVRSLSTGEILDGLRHFRLDAGVAYVESGREPDLDTLALWEEDHVFLTPAAGPLEGREEIGWVEAAAQPLCLLTPDMQNRRIIDQVFASLGCQPRPSLETNSIVSLLAHVSAGCWSSIVPRSVLDLIGTPQGVRVLRLVAPQVTWATGLVTLRTEHPAPMVAALRAVAGDLRQSFGNDE